MTQMMNGMDGSSISTSSGHSTKRVKRSKKTALTLYSSSVDNTAPGKMINNDTITRMLRVTLNSFFLTLFLIKAIHRLHVVTGINSLRPGCY